MLKAFLIIGPKGSLYEGGYLFFNIDFPKIIHIHHLMYHMFLDNIRIHQIYM